MQDLEKKFSDAIGDGTKYDPFMELNAGFVTDDLDHYVKAFQGDKVPFFPGKFVDKASGSTYYTVTVQTPGSLDTTSGSFVVLQLIASSSEILSAMPDIHLYPVQQLSSATLKDALSRTVTAASIGSDKPPLTMAKVTNPY